MARTFFFAYGFSRQWLWWRSEGDKPGVVLDPRTPVEGFRCQKCGTIVLPPLAPRSGSPNPLADTVFRDQTPRPDGP